MIEVIAYTDGSANPVDRSGGWGVVLLCKGVHKELSGSSSDTTNNRMELTAVLEAVKAMKLPCRLVVRTDSTDVIGWLRGTYQRKNAALNVLCWEIITTAVQKEIILELEQVAGHSGDYYNDRADLLATMARHTMLEQTQQKGAD